MILVDFLTLPEGELIGFCISGHADYEEEGTDIVCAAVSSSAYLTVNTVTEVLSVEPLTLKVEEGYMYFRLERRDIPVCQDILMGLKIHLLGLEEQYSNYIRVGYVEV